jgi:hypothetical protein
MGPSCTAESTLASTTPPCLLQAPAGGSGYGTHCRGVGDQACVTAGCMYFVDGQLVEEKSGSGFWGVGFRMDGSPVVS